MSKDILQVGPLFRGRTKATPPISKAHAPPEREARSDEKALSDKAKGKRMLGIIWN
jgi:hypothetical protein